GDVKLAVPLGLVLGWLTLWALYLAVVLAAAVAVVGLGTGRLELRSRVPFAPFILGGTLLHFLLPLALVLDWVAGLTL
ncbi:MAG: prepilin peptidase, partial [Bacteroidota bacterium]